MPDQLGELLNEVADSELDGFEVHSPAGGVTNSSDAVPKRPRTWVLVATAALVLAVFVAYVVGSGSGSSGVQPPADGGIVRTPTTDSTTTSTTIASDPAAVEVLSAAIENTMATSWVADIAVDGRPREGESEVTYHPPSPEEGRPYATARIIGSNAADGSEYGLTVDELGQLIPCNATGVDCEPPLWGRIDPTLTIGTSQAYPGLSQEDTLDWYFSRYIPLRNAETTIAAFGDEPGVVLAGWNSIHALLDGGESVQAMKCGVDGCGHFILRIEDGVVTSLELRYRDPDGIQGSLDGEDLVTTMTLRDFGNAPKVEIPAAQDIVDATYSRRPVPPE